MTTQRTLHPLAIILLAIFVSACDLRPHASVTVIAPPISNAELIEHVADTMGGLGYMAEEFVAVNGTPMPREEVAFRALHPGLYTRTYGEALRSGARSTVLIRPGSSRMHFIGGLSEAWVTFYEQDTSTVEFELIQATNRFVTFDEFGRREYQLLVQELSSRFGAANVRPSSSVE
jgi:hypothetical protein